MVATGSTRSWRGDSGGKKESSNKRGVSRENKKFRNGSGIDVP
jgi:hypothetical protein